MLESELGATVEEEFASFDFEPLAAASIGQTHRAVLKTGERVVVKVQRPGIEDVVHRDAAVLRMAANVSRPPGRGAPARSASSGSPTSSSRRSSASSTTAPRHRAASAFLEHLEDERRDRGPDRLPGAVDATRARDGGDPRRHRRRPRRDRGARRSRPTCWRAGCCSRSSTRCCATGCTTRDPHPGNIFVDPEGTLWFLDFGAVGRLEPDRSSSRCRRWRSGSSSTTRSCSPARSCRLAGGDESGDSRALEADIGLVLTRRPRQRAASTPRR